MGYYYKTAVKLSWLIVGGSLCALAVLRGAYQIIPLYLLFMMVGGTIPALICAWALRDLGRITKVNSEWRWMIRGAYLGVTYVIMSNFIMKSVVGHVSLGSIKGFLCLVIFGPSILMESGLYGLLIIAFAGMVNGLVLYLLNRRIH